MCCVGPTVPSLQTWQVGEPRGPRYPELTAAPKSFIPAGAGTESLWAELCAPDTTHVLVQGAGLPVEPAAEP